MKKTLVLTISRSDLIKLVIHNYGVNEKKIESIKLSSVGMKITAKGGKQ